MRSKHFTNMHFNLGSHLVRAAKKNLHFKKSMPKEKEQKSRCSRCHSGTGEELPHRNHHISAHATHRLLSWEGCHLPALDLSTDPVQLLLLLLKPLQK